MYVNVTVSLTLVSNKLSGPFFSTLSQWDKNGSALKFIFEETVPESSVNFENRNSRDSHKNQNPASDLNFVFTESQYNSDKIHIDQICRRSVISLPLAKHTQRISMNTRFMVLRVCLEPVTPFFVL